VAQAGCTSRYDHPFTLAPGEKFELSQGDFVFVPDVRAKLAAGEETFNAKAITAGGSVSDIKLVIKGLTPDEKQIILDGCLMNYYKNQNNGAAK
jgi:aconitate hydratase